MSRRDRVVEIDGVDFHKAYDIADFYAYPDEDDKKEAKLYEAARRKAINFANWFEDFILKLEEENNQEED